MPAQRLELSAYEGTVQWISHTGSQLKLVTVLGVHVHVQRSHAPLPGFKTLEELFPILTTIRLKDFLKSVQNTSKFHKYIHA